MITAATRAGSNVMESRVNSSEMSRIRVDGEVGWI